MNNALIPAGLLVNLLIWNQQADLLRLAGRGDHRPVVVAEPALGRLDPAAQKISINRPMMTSSPTRK